tara:strand:+ start:84 stop:464 length:381 start_codon:yes stop_codon:yes gene_type:complete
LAIISTGKYLKREHVTEEGSTHKVVSCTEEPINLSDGGSEMKWILTLENLKPIVLNATNIRRCVAAFNTSETNDWVGRSIVCYDDPTIEFGGRQVGGIRLRAVPTKAKSKAKAKSTKPTDVDEIPF